MEKPISAAPACAVEDCPKGGKIVRGYCDTHYYRLRVHGDVRADVPIKDIGVRDRCSIDDCARQGVLRRDLCTMHYQRWLKHGDPHRERPRQAEKCVIDECGAQPTVGKGLCRKHFKRLHRTGSTADPVSEPRTLGECSAAGCQKIESRRGLCSMHYTRWKKHGDVEVTLRTWTSQAGLACSMAGCDVAANSQGLCRRHWVAAYHAKNRKQRNARMRAHYLANREEYYAKANRRRQIIEVNMDALDRALSADYRRAIAHDVCGYCSAASSQVDHFFPIAKGGTDHWWNLRRACEPCNKSKAAHCGTWFLLLQGGGREPVLAPDVE